MRAEISASPAFEPALRERVARLQSFKHAYFGRIRNVKRLNDRSATLALVSEHTSGVRLSDMLAMAERRAGALDINAALCLVRQLVPAVAVLHESGPDAFHGAIGPERLVIMQNARLVIVEHVLGGPLAALNYPVERYWRDFRVALPPSAGTPVFDQRADVAQVGLTALSLILGRLVDDIEYPSRIEQVVESAWATTAHGGPQPLPKDLRQWLMRALQLDPKHSFQNAVEARREFDIVLRDSDYAPEPAALAAFLTQFRAWTRAEQEQQGSSRDRHDSPAPSFDTLASISSGPTLPQTPVAAAPERHTEPVRIAEPASRPAPSEPAVHAADRIRIEAPKLSVVPPADTAPKVDTAPKAEPAAPRLVAEAPKVRPIRPQPAAIELGPLAASTAEPRRPLEVTEPPRSSETRQPREPKSVPAAVIEEPKLPPAPAGDAGGDVVGSRSWDALEHADPHEEPEAMDMHSKRPARWRSKAIAAAVVAFVVGSGIVVTRMYADPETSAADSGTVRVDTNPSGLQVFIDGQARGVTPLTFSVKAGQHVMELRGDGEPRTVPLTVEAGAQLSQYLEFGKGASSPATGHLQVRTEPAGARVMVDGVARGTSPVTIRDLTPGEHVVALDSDAGSVRQSIVVEAGNTASLVVPMAASHGGAPASGWIAVTAAADVELFEDGRLLGSSQMDRIMLPAGTHKIDVVSNALGYRSTRSVQVVPGKVSQLAVEFPTNTIALNAAPWAEVWIDGERVGETPIGNHPITIGTHSVVFRHPELGEERRTVTVTLEAPAKLSIDLRKK